MAWVLFHFMCGCWFQGLFGPPFPWTALLLDRPKFRSFFARELQTRTFERPGALNTTKIPREDPQRGKKRTNFAAGEGKKARNFGPPHPSGPHPSGPHPSGPHPSGPHPSGPHPSGPHFFWVWAPTLQGPPFGAPTLRAPWVWPLVCIKKKTNN